VAAGSGRRQRAEGGDSNHTGVDRELGGGAQRPNELPGDSVERRSDRSGTLTPPRGFPKGTATAGERKAVAKRWLLSVRWAGAARSYEARRAKTRHVERREKHPAGSNAMLRPSARGSES
jgi:hypothetical protein